MSPELIRGDKCSEKTDIWYNICLCENVEKTVSNKIFGYFKAKATIISKRIQNVAWAVLYVLKETDFKA